MNLGHAHKTSFWYLLEVFSKFFDENPRHFYGGVPRGGTSPCRPYKGVPDRGMKVLFKERPSYNFVLINKNYIIAQYDAKVSEVI